MISLDSTPYAPSDGRVASAAIASCRNRAMRRSDIRLLRLLAPHICRTFAISDALDLKSVRQNALEATLDALVSGVYLTDREARVVYMNRAAERQIESRKVLRIIDHRLSTAGNAARKLLSQAIVDAIS